MAEADARWRWALAAAGASAVGLAVLVYTSPSLRARALAAAGLAGGAAATGAPPGARKGARWLPVASGPNRAPVVLKAGGLEVHVSPLGATLRRVQVPGRDGAAADVVLGFDGDAPYADGTSPYFGCVVGRVANRIANGAFRLGGREVKLDTNDGAGPNCLHGGREGFDKRWWDTSVTADCTAVTLTLESPDGDQGFPGKVSARVTYRIETEGDLAFGDSSLVTEFEATCDRPTPVNLAQHAYWNLAGHGSGESVLDHEIRVAANYYTPVDGNMIPTGVKAPVRGTAFDFGRMCRIGERAAELPGGGYDHNFCLAGPNGSRACGEMPYPPRLAASVFHRKSGRAMDVLTDAPGVQFYTGNFLDGSIVGKGGARYGKHAGLCLETQGFPNAVNAPLFPSVVLQPGETYRHIMVHRFYVR